MTEKIPKEDKIEEPIDDYSDDLKDDDLFKDDLGFDGFGETATPPIDKHKDLLKDLTDFSPEIQSRIRNWLGLGWDEEANDYIKKYPAVINEKGAKWAIGYLRTYQSKTNIITNINQNEMKNLKIDIIRLAWRVFPCKFEEFEIKDIPNQYRLSQELEHSAFLVLFGAGDGKYTKFLGESVNRNESVNYSQPVDNNRMPMRRQGGWLGNKLNKFLGRQ